MAYTGISCVVAGHGFEIRFPDWFPYKDVLGEKYSVFSATVKGRVFALTLLEPCKAYVGMEICGLLEFIGKYNDASPYTWIYRLKKDACKNSVNDMLRETSGGFSQEALLPDGCDYVFGFSESEDSPECLIFTSRDYSQAVMYWTESAKEACGGIHSFSGAPDGDFGDGSSRNAGLPDGQCGASHACGPDDALLRDYLSRNRRICSRMRFHIENCLMLLYAFNTADKDTVLIHASAVEWDSPARAGCPVGRTEHSGGDAIVYQVSAPEAGKSESASCGAVFLGKSGTGKSTHARLWLKNYPDCRLLNDDNPAIRIVGEKAFVFGTPWSGKTPCYKDAKSELKGIVRLRQAKSNNISRMDPIRSYASLMGSVSCMHWDKRLSDGVHDTVSRIIGMCPSFMLECLPDDEAAKLCRSVFRDNAR